MKTTASLLVVLCALNGFATNVQDAFEYDASGLRDPMIRTTPAPPVDEEGRPVDDESTPAVAKITNRLEDIQRVVAASRIEGVAVGPNGRFVIINDRVVSEGEPISAEYDVRVARIEPNKVTFTLENQALTYILTSPEEETLP